METATVTVNSESKGKGSNTFLTAAMSLWLVALLQTLQNLQSVQWSHAITWAMLAVLFAILGGAQRGNPGHEVGRMVGALCLALFIVELFLAASRVDGGQFQTWAALALAAILACLAWVFLNNARKAISRYRAGEMKP